jgi:rhodanese-related sulfurtransferase
MHLLPDSLNRLKRDEDLVVVCQHGIRSVAACEFLQANGFNSLYNVMEGMEGWPGDLVLEDDVAQDPDDGAQEEGVSVK